GPPARRWAAGTARPAAAPAVRVAASPHLRRPSSRLSSRRQAFTWSPGAGGHGGRIWAERVGTRLDGVSGAPQNDRQKRSLIGSQYCLRGGRGDRGGAGPGGDPADVRRAGRRSQPGRGRGGGGGGAAFHPGARRGGGDGHGR